MQPRIGIGKRVKKARSALKPSLTQKGLLKRLQSVGLVIGLPRLTNIENGTVGPHQLELIALAEVMNTTVHWLLTGLDG